MLKVLTSVWALLLGMFMLQIGNGMQSTLLGIRGDLEGFSTLQMSFVMSGYFLGFLFGSRLAPEMIRRVGHVRVFAALASLISAMVVLYPALPNPVVWGLARVVIGFSFSGVYVTAESWLNDASDNATRGKSLSLYMIVQMVGMVTAQMLIPIADPGGFVLFIIPSILVSLSFAPILLSISPTPAFATTKPLSLGQILKISPLGCVGMFLLGGIFAAQFGMAPVYGAEVGLSVANISLLVSVIFLAAVVLQYPIGFLSDRMDRRMLILVSSAVCGFGALIGIVFGGHFTMLLVAAFFIGGTSNPLYSLLIAYTNDFLDNDDMAAAAGGLVFINGLGAVSGPVIVGFLMTQIGPSGFFIFIAALAFAITGYAAYRMTQRAAPPVEETDHYAPVWAASSPMAVEYATEYARELAEDSPAPKSWRDHK